MSSKPVLIICGGGKTGRRVDALLRAKGIATRPVSRSTRPAFDWEDPATWPAAFDGVKAAYITYQPDLAVPGAVEAITRIGEIARENGLERLVLLSGRGEPGARRAEAALETAGVPWTIVRASWFAQNFSEHFLQGSVMSGTIALPVGDVREPFVDVDDIAEVVVAALTEEGHQGRVYEVTGPEALTFAEATQEIAKAAGRPLSYVQITPDEFEAGLRGQQIPGDLVHLFMELFTELLDGRNEAVAHGVQAALGRPAKSFSAYARDAAAAGAWDT